MWTKPILNRSCCSKTYIRISCTVRYNLFLRHNSYIENIFLGTGECEPQRVPKRAAVLVISRHQCSSRNVAYSRIVVFILILQTFVYKIWQDVNEKFVKPFSGKPAK